MNTTDGTPALRIERLRKSFVPGRPALDGIATRGTPAYIRESLLEPSKVLAKGYEQYKVSPMPPMGDIFSPQELEDIQAFVLTLK